MRLLAFLAMLMAGGCTVYVPRTVGEPLAPGTEIRARLNTPGAIRISTSRGRTLSHIEGKFLFLERDSLQIALLETSEFGRPWEGVDTLGLATSEILRLEEKKIDATRTALLVGGIGIPTGLAIGALFRAAIRSRGEGEGEVDLILIPLISFAW